MNLNKKITLILTLVLSVVLNSYADISAWTGIYRGACVVEQPDGKRHEIPCTLLISENPSVGLSQVLTVGNTEYPLEIEIINLSTAPKHQLIQVSEQSLTIPPLFAHPVSIQLKKEPGGFNETLITGDLVEYKVSYSQVPKVIRTLHLKLGKLK
jgi:hypothetical protein